ncbi:NOG1 family protein [Methanotrichaceae archaeon M04Ac]|uniref:NOG1 family protein n=1 Tax=Candidatus Methanocrinis alkalitolerans TaxID=3033395 RepID=A0ABT5XCU2_9EURY|nr:NOG1 family protein [Candidatus Methanocrinis alkalitolerans]MCR3884418.1 NOG1 family protein [Methanothrix sp.]MDF0592476.1 NOG1 family protein [Candidatus Methanocrinis alkalitolerans]
MFERLPTVPTSQELVDRAFRRSKRAASSQNKDEAMLMTAGNILSDNLANLVRKYPSFMNIPPFYHDLADAVVGVDDMRIHLSRVTWAASQIRTITKDHLTRMKGTVDKPSVRRAAFGRMASVMKSIEPDLLFLNDARQKLRFMPTVDPDVPTIIVAGYPNVGKSSFMISVTGARPEIASYPFTTKGVGVGHFIRDHQRYQVVDTPGLLDRPLSQRNEIELQAIAALRHLRGAVLFILDPSEYCGFSLEEQLRLLSDVRGWLHLPVLVVSNKSDLSDYGGADMTMSTQSGAGVAEVLDRMVEMLGEVDKEEGESREE